ncbi:MAG: non-hydrolyzing UDP-N-acetylglucosamine 2-epimerase [Candidatus Odinarchaeia archaeon]
MNDLKILRKNELEDKVCIVLGTRPGIIKFSPIIRELKKRNKPFFIIHTGQHYSYELDKIFFDELKLPEPEYKINNISKTKYHGEQTAKMLIGAEKALLKEKPYITLVGGDANTNLAGALATRKLNIHLGHIEAGLRSNDWRMPEEHNRVMIDHISDILFPPTEDAKNNLITEQIKGKILLTGNTIADSVLENSKIAGKESDILNKLNLTEKEYFLLTVHREENVDYKENLVEIIKCIKTISDEFKKPIIFPMHPRTLQRLNLFSLKSKIEKIEHLQILPPLGYLDFLVLMRESELVFTDSGGIQEESCILKIPCVTLRDNTERPETIKVGANYLAGVYPDKVIQGAKIMIEKKTDWSNPFGFGASKKIVDEVVDSFDVI